MGHLDIPEVLILLGTVAFVGLALHNWILSHGDHRHHHDHGRRLH